MPSAPRRGKCAISQLQLVGLARHRTHRGILRSRRTGRGRPADPRRSLPLSPRGPAGCRCEVLVGAEVVDPQLVRPRLLRRGLAVEEHHVRLHATGVEDPGRQPQQGVDVALLQQSPPDGLAGSALKQDVVGDDDGGASVDGEQRPDMLQEVELLVGGGGPEVLLLRGMFDDPGLRQRLGQECVIQGGPLRGEAPCVFCLPPSRQYPVYVVPRCLADAIRHLSEAVAHPTCSGPMFVLVKTIKTYIRGASLSTRSR